MAPKERAPKPKPPAAAVRTPARKRRLPDGETEPPASIKKPKQQWSWGVTWMLFRVASVITLGLSDRVVEEWTRCTGKTDKHVADSYVHRYHYEVGFLQDDHAEEAENPGLAAARRRTRQLGLGKIKSHPDRVTRHMWLANGCCAPPGCSTDTCCCRALKNSQCHTARSYSGWGGQSVVVVAEGLSFVFCP